ncbi:MAG: hypothetical protein ACW99Q_19520, partial [Candidatus Kariarchaeaceae archaeon]
PGVYNITKNSSIYDDRENISWSNGTITINLNGLSNGTHIFIITIFDISQNVSFDTVNITINDTTLPTVDSPDDITYSEGQTGNIIVWTVEDLHPGVYNVTIDGSIYNNTASWSNGTISVNVDSLTKGSYEFNISVYDFSGNNVFDIVVVIVDFTSPDVDSPNDATYSEGQNGTQIVWTIGDRYPGEYNVTKDGSIYNSLENVSWVNGTVIIDVNGLLKGSHVFNITVYDESRNLSFDVVTVTVLDTTLPIIDSPDDIYYSEGNNGNTIVWTVSDLYPGVYNVTKDGAIYNATNSWSSGPLSINVDGLTKGTYVFNITVHDLSDNVVFDIVVVTVDFTPPDVDSPNNIIYGIGGLGNSIVWNVGDRYPGVYNVTKDGVIYKSTSSWINGSISINVDGLAIGSYTFNISIFDESGNNSFDVVIVLVTDDVPPVVDSPADIFYSEGQTGNEIVWTVSDLSPGVFDVTKDGIIYNSTNSWVSGPIIVNVDTLLKGVYVFNITVFDDSGSSVSDIVLVTVTDIISPIVSGLSNVTLEQFLESQFVIWNANESYPDYYEVYIDETLESTISWNGSEIYFLIDTSILGLHNYTIIIYDESGNWGTDTVYITIIDIVNPQINSTSEYFFEEGVAGNSILWNSFDHQHRNYTVLRDGVPRDSNLLINNNSSIVLFIDSFLDAGLYNYTIIIQDTSGNTSFNTIIVNIQDRERPSITKSPNSIINYIEQSTGNDLEWIVTDNHPSFFVLYQNNSVVGNSTWIDDVEIEIDIDGLIKGVYNFTILFYDTSANFINETIIVIVEDQIPPLITKLDFNQTYIEDTQGKTLRVNVTDYYPAFFEIYANNSIYYSSDWNNQDGISINIDSFPRGFHNFTFVIYDESNNFVISSIIFYVLDNQAPTFHILPQDIAFKHGEVNNILRWNVSDKHPERYFVYINGIESTLQGLWNSSHIIEINADDFSIGIYNLTLVVRDDTGNISTDSVLINVKDPQIIETLTPLLQPEI